MNSPDPPRRALISVWDKAGVVDLARELRDMGWELLASGGTARAIATAGVAVVDVADYTGSPSICGHRVVTLHPRVHGGILADRDDPEHRADLAANLIDPIDLVVCNLYPFGSEPDIEMIDIGGPAMLRAAAKNHAHVAVVVDPADYPVVLAELRSQGCVSEQTRRRLARFAFAHTAGYDAAIVEWLDATPEPTARTAAADGAAVASESQPAGLASTIHLALERAELLRYGENPHQRGARYRRVGGTSFWDGITRHGGLALSYLNLCDVDAAWRLVGALGSDPAVVIVKHANPCGVAVADRLVTAYERALACDPLSAFGGVVVSNQVIDSATVSAMESAAMADLVLAPGYAPGVIERLLAKRRNTRILEPSGTPAIGTPATGTAANATPTSGAPDDSIGSGLELRRLGDDFLVQDAPRFEVGPDDWQAVTQRRPSATELADAAFAWRVCAHVASNAVVLAYQATAWGIGAGQQNRVAAMQLAAGKAAGRAVGGVAAGDAFFPFPDGIHAAADAGVALIVQPGGSVNDAANIAAADERGLAMVFTGERQFRH